MAAVAATFVATARPLAATITPAFVPAVAATFGLAATTVRLVHRPGGVATQGAGEPLHDLEAAREHCRGEGDPYPQHLAHALRERRRSGAGSGHRSRSPTSWPADVGPRGSRCWGRRRAPSGHRIAREWQAGREPVRWPMAVVLARAGRGAGGFLAILIEGRFGFVKNGASIRLTESRHRGSGSFGFLWHGRLLLVGRG